MRTTVIAVMLTLCVTACTAATHGSGPGLQRNVITLAEIQAATVPTTNLWDFIATSRPHFLRDRGAGSFSDTSPVRAVVYLDGSLLGDIQVLKALGLSSVKLIQYMSGADATTRYGLGHSGGAILLSTR